jgi:hypothetical protein
MCSGRQIAKTSREKANITMRLSDLLVQAVEKLKGPWQESSTSEVARRLLELGLDTERRQREERADLRSALLDDPQAALVQFRDRYYRNELLQREEWAFIAQRVHEAYGRARRTFVTRAVLVDVQATRALFIARTRHTGRAEYAADGYHRSKLNLGLVTAARANPKLLPMKRRRAWHGAPFDWVGASAPFLSLQAAFQIA